MNHGRTVFAQVLDGLSLPEFRRCVARYRGNYRTRSLSCWEQFLCLSFAQLTYRESLRDIEACLRAMPTKLYHLGIRGGVSRSTLADANERRDWRMYRDVAMVLIEHTVALYGQPPWSQRLRRTVYALDSTVIELCLSLCPWARFGRQGASIKIHTLLNTTTQVPVFIRVTPRRVSDNKMIAEMPVTPGAIYLMDRGYVDYKRLYPLTLAGAFFVTRARQHSNFARQHSRPIIANTGIRSDQVVRLARAQTKQDYPAALRKIRYIDPQTHKQLTFLTNNFTWAATTIAALYKSRWQVELFFKWIKQNLRIRAFYGTSANAVQTQIWIAISAYLLVAILRKQLNLKLSMHSILQVLSVSLFEKTPVPELLTTTDLQTESPLCENQLQLLGF